ncbi:cell division protein FtsA [Bacteroidia bacterium]|nr:cell division protein FtsA [Bacteroidia bacterium]
MEQFIAALDLGTFKMTAMFARKNFDGTLSGIQSESLPSRNSIKRGCVYNIEDAANNVSALIRKLNRKTTIPISKVYVGIGGQSLRTELCSIKKEVEDGTVTQELLNTIQEEIRNQYEDDVDEVLDILPQEYYLDGQLDSKPRGASASSIEAQYLMVIGGRKLKRISRIVPKDVEIAGYIVSPLATAQAVLTDNEKNQGCALIEFGAGITYLSIYKNGYLKYMVAIPLGGIAITKDIRSLNVSEEEAEDIKIKYGSAIWDVKEEKKIKVGEDTPTPRDIEIKNLTMCIEARINEIFENAIYQIEASGYPKNMLNAGIIITGGGANLKDLPEFIHQKQTGMNVRLAFPRTENSQNGPFLSTADSTAAGLLMLGKENCLGEKKIQKSIVQEPIQPRISNPPIPNSETGTNFSSVNKEPVVEKNVSISNILLKKKDITLSVDEKEDLEVSIFPQDATNKKIKWSINNEEIIAVSSKDSLKIKVTGRREGSTVITATTEDGNKSASCHVIVGQKKKSRIEKWAGIIFDADDNQ